MTNHEAGHQFFRVGDRTIVIESEDPVLIRQVGALFPDYVSHEPDHEMTVYRVGRVGVRWALERSGREAARWTAPSRSGIVDELEFALTLDFLSAQPRSAFIHGSAVLVKPDSAVLVLGKSGAGKSSLALHWSVGGRPVFGDDIVRLEPNGKISAFKRLFEVTPKRLKNLGVDARSGHFWLPTSAEVWFDPREYGGWADGAHGVGLVALLDRGEEGPDEFVEVGVEEVLGWLSASLMPEGLAVGQCLDDLILLVSKTRCVRASVYDISTAAESLIDMVE